MLRRNRAERQSRLPALSERNQAVFLTMPKNAAAIANTQLIA